MVDPTHDDETPTTLDGIRALYPGVHTRPDSDDAAGRVLAGVDHLDEVATPEEIALMRESLSLWFARSFDEDGSVAEEWSGRQSDEG